tara:strand:- start:49 stop:276 length:228 start_codon:yes stop_codon:yes gene_type:complete
MKDKLLDYCSKLLQQNDIKKEIRNIISPLIELIFLELAPFIYLILSLIILTFLLNLAIFIILIIIMRKKNFAFSI